MRYSASRYRLSLTLSLSLLSLFCALRASLGEEGEGVTSSFSLLLFISLYFCPLANPSFANCYTPFVNMCLENKIFLCSISRKLIPSVLFSVLFRKVTTFGGRPSRMSFSRRTPPLPFTSAWKTDRRDIVSINDYLSRIACFIDAWRWHLNRRDFWKFIIKLIILINHFFLRYIFMSN